MRLDPGGWQVRLDDALIARNTQSGAWQNKTVFELAVEMAAREPQRVTHVFGDRAHPIGETVAQAEALAAALQARGLRAGDVVTFQLPNWSEALVIDLACAALGLVIAPIIPIYREAEAGFMLADCRAKAAFVPAEYRGYDYLAMMHRLAPKLPDLKVISSVRVDGGDGDSYEALLAEGRRLVDRPRVDPNSIKLIMYTSGTTGRAKGVLHSHNTMAYVMREMLRYWGHRPDDTILMASPVTHITGFGAGMESALVCPGMRTVFMERWEPTAAIGIIDRERATMSVGATPFLQELLAEAARQGSRLPSMRVYACGGAAVPPNLIRAAWTQFAQCRAFRVYGSSEVPMVTFGHVGDGETDLAAETDGRILIYDVKVTDDAGNALPRGQEGEICARGPGMMLGYADPEQTAESFDDEGYFHSGDLGYVTEGNAVVITGRKKDLINRGGEKISAKEVEDILHSHPAVEESAVVAMPHQRLGETVCAYVKPVPGNSFSFEEMLAHVAAAGVARQKYPEKLVVMDELPRTASGKIRKDLLREDIRKRLAGGE